MPQEWYDTVEIVVERTKCMGIAQQTTGNDTCGRRSHQQQVEIDMGAAKKISMEEYIVSQKGSMSSLQEHPQV